MATPELSPTTYIDYSRRRLVWLEDFQLGSHYMTSELADFCDLLLVRTDSSHDTFVAFIPADELGSDDFACVKTAFRHFGSSYHPSKHRTHVVLAVFVFSTVSADRVETVQKLRQEAGPEVRQTFLPWSVDLSEESVVPHSGAPAKKRVLRSLSEFSEPNSAQLSEEQARPEYRVPPKKERSRLPSWARARFKIPGNPWVTHLMLAIIAGVFVLQYIKGGSTSIPVLVTLGARSNVLVSHGQWWRLFTYQFLHIGLMHFGLNAFSLYWLGPGVEYAFGHLSFLLIYLGSGTAGGIAGYLFGGPMARTVAAGASGAIFGLFGAYAYYALTQPGNTRRLALRQIGLIILLNIVFGLSQPGIDNLAHMGGLAGGFLLSVIFGPTEKTSLTHRFLAVSLLLGIFLASGGMQLLSIMLHS